MDTGTTLVLGGTGKTGRRVATRLRLSGAAVRAVSRSSQTRFDWSDRGTWDAAVDGVTAAYLVAPREPGLMHEFVDVAKEAGVRHLVLLSGRGADRWGDSDFGLDMRSAEDAVRGSDLDWTILRPNNFAQNFDEDVFLPALLAGELALPAGDVGEPFIDIDDVADVAVAVLRNPAEHVGHTHELTGPRSITFAEAVELISRATGQPIAYKQISADEYTAQLVDEGLSHEDASHVSEMFVLMQRGLLADPTDGVEGVLGRAPRTFEEYVARTASAGTWQR